MPLTTIDLHEGTTTPEQRRAISAALHEAMQEVLGIPADDRFHVFSEHPEGTMFHEDTAFGISRDERMLFITFSFNNRSAETKARLYEAAIRLLAQRAGVSPDAVLIRVIETASENWWASGRVVDPTTGYDERMGEEPAV